MQDIRAAILAAEALLAEAGITYAAFCQQLDVHPSTWRVWRRGDGLPSLRLWQRVEEGLERLRDEDRKRSVPSREPTIVNRG
jgi:transposase-like protein